eukprot:11137084-Alexandrium_andersonii.AAC.1
MPRSAIDCALRAAALWLPTQAPPEEGEQLVGTIGGAISHPRGCPTHAAAAAPERSGSDSESA